MATTKQTMKEEANGKAAGGALGNLYNEGIQEIVKLAEDDNYARRVDNGPLKEARGKDTWQVHSQLHSISRLNQNLGNHANSLESHLNDLDGHLDAATELLSKLVNQTHKENNAALASNLETIGSWVTGARKALLEANASTQKEVIATVKDSFKTLDKNLNETSQEIGEAISTAQSALNDRLESVHKSMKSAFQELARATAGSEENIRAQTDSFSKAVETLLNDVRGDLDAKIAEFRDDATRLIDKRFNQSDVSFAAVRADQEVIKALLTDIIKDRLGRAEPRVR